MLDIASTGHYRHHGEESQESVSRQDAHIQAKVVEIREFLNRHEAVTVMHVDGVGHHEGQH